MIVALLAPRAWLFAAAVALPLASCGPTLEPCPEEAPLASLVDHDEWRRVPFAEDPFTPGEGDEIYPCEDRDMTVETLGEERTWSVTTGSCNWATVQQPLARDLHAGDELFVEVFWFSQQDFPGAVATVGVALGDEIVLAHPVEVPTEGSLLEVSVTVPRDVPAGTPLCFHVGNHGSNSWNLLDVSLVDEESVPAHCPIIAPG